MNAARVSDAARYEMPPLASAIERAVLERWVVTAPPGHRIRYAEGRVPPRDAGSFVRARELADKQVVTLVQERPGGGTVEYWAVKRAMPRAVRDVLEEARSSGIAADLVTLAVAELLLSAVREGRVCPSNAELAAACGLGAGRDGADAASYRVRLAVRFDLVRIEQRGPLMRRIAIDPATGARTPEGRL